MQEVAHPAGGRPRHVGQGEVAARQEVQVLGDEEGQPLGFRVEPFCQLPPVELPRWRERSTQVATAAGASRSSPMTVAVPWRTQSPTSWRSRWPAGTSSLHQTQQDTEPVRTQAAHEIGEPVQRGAVRTVEIVEQQQAGALTGEQGGEGVPQPVEEAALGSKWVGRLVGGRADEQVHQGRFQPAHLGEPGAVQGGQACPVVRLGRSALEQRGQRCIGQRRLAFIADGAQHRGPAVRPIPGKGGGKGGLAHTRLPFEDDQAARRLAA